MPSWINGIRSSNNTICTVPLGFALSNGMESKKQDIALFALMIGLFDPYSSRYVWHCPITVLWTVYWASVHCPNNVSNDYLLPYLWNAHSGAASIAFGTVISLLFFGLSLPVFRNWVEFNCYIVLFPKEWDCTSPSTSISPSECCQFGRYISSIRS